MISSPQKSSVLPAAPNPMASVATVSTEYLEDPFASKGREPNLRRLFELVLGYLLYASAMIIVLVSVCIALLLIVGITLRHGPEHEFARRARTAIQRWTHSLLLDP